MKFIYNIAYNMERKGVLYMLFNQLPFTYFLTKDQNLSTPPSGIVLRSFGFPASKLIGFQIFWLSDTRWNLFKKRVVQTKYEIYVFIFINIAALNISFRWEVYIIVFCTGSIWEVNLHWLGIVLLYTVTDQDIVFSGT